MRVVFLEPAVAGSRTGLGVGEESVAVGSIVIIPSQQLSTGEEEPTHIARLIGYPLEIGTEALLAGLAGGRLSPGGMVARGRPVHLGHHDGCHCSHRSYLRIPSPLEVAVVHHHIVIAVAAVVPARVAVHGIAYVGSLDGILGETGILRLPSQSGHQDNAVFAVLHNRPYLPLI